MLDATSMRSPAIALAAALLSISEAALAGGAIGERARGRMIEESVLVVWNAGREHLFFAGTADGVDPPASYVVPVPIGARAAAGDGGAAAAFARLSEGRAPPPLGASEPRAPRAIGAGGGKCEDGELPCPPGAWLAGRPHAMAAFVQTPFVSGSPLRAPWVHVELDDLPAPFAPFSEPPDSARASSDPPPVDETHPPRVGIWVELGTETKTGAWERAMDETANRLGGPLGDCYAPALVKRRRLEGDVHAQGRVDVRGRASIDGSRASSPALTPALRCLELAIEKASWPLPTGPRAVPFEVHATLRPPSARARVLRIYLLTSAEVAPHVGSAADPRVPEDTRTLVAREPDASELREAFPDATRAALGIDLGVRWRLLVLETTSEVRPSADDLHFRVVAPLPPQKPGEAPLPILTREDRPEAFGGHARRRFFKRRGVRIVVGLFALAFLAGAVVWSERRRSARGVA